MSFLRKLFGLPEPYKERRQRTEAGVRELVRSHIQALATKRAQLLQEDAYGTVLRDDWDDEVAYFCFTIIDPKFDFSDLCALYPPKNFEMYSMDRLFDNSHGDSPLWAIIEEEIDLFESKESAGWRD